MGGATSERSFGTGCDVRLHASPFLIHVQSNDERHPNWEKKRERDKPLLQSSVSPCQRTLWLPIVGRRPDSKEPHVGSNCLS